MADVVNAVETATTTLASTVTTVVKKPNVILSFFSDVWNSLVSLDNKLNVWLNGITKGKSALAITACVIIYLLIKPFISGVIKIAGTIPAVVLVAVKAILDAVISILSAVIPVVFSAIPYAIGIIVVLLVIVELVGVVKSIIK